MNIIRRLIGAIGGVILSQKSADNLIGQRDRAVIELVNLENSKLKLGLFGIVLSKDRALQLYSLLDSYNELVINQAPLTIIYTASTAEHQIAYEEVIAIVSRKFSNIYFIKETDGFRKTLLSVLDKVQVKNIFFLVDDIVFIRKVDLSFASLLDTSHFILSLRHSPYLSRSYTSNKKQYPPQLLELKENHELFKFRWFEKGCEWSDPWSVDGQILSTAEVKVISKISNFAAPNSYEAALKSFNSICKDRLGLCYFESKILNIPINRVQNECDNISGDVSPDLLLEEWNNGKMLDTSKLLTHIPQSPHEEHILQFKIR